MRKFLLLGALLVLLAGCAGMNYALEHYTGVPLVEFPYKKDTWRIFDKPKENRLMITSSIEKASEAGAMLGLTFGAIRRFAPEHSFKEAASAYLKSTGRECKLQPGFLVAQPQWEFKYTCKKK